ncbi:MAG TPA: sigma-70 family RNA polymerase sigma factor [Thermoanaerobaculia bacterium]|nr:sigma-70 family RNA polymerase sigma factor [Thermoanaerobaculia bacterium]
MAESSRESAAHDAALVERIGRQDGEALRELHDRYAGLLIGLARRIVGSREEAEDVVQEALVQAWRQAARYQPSRSSVSTWLAMITRSRAIDRIRTRRVVDRTAQAAHDEGFSGHASAEGPSTVIHRERRARLQSVMEELPAEQRQMLELAYFGGLTQAEIAEETGIPLGTVKTRTLLAMRKLRTALQHEVAELL